VSSTLISSDPVLQAARPVPLAGALDGGALDGGALAGDEGPDDEGDGVPDCAGADVVPAGVPGEVGLAVPVAPPAALVAWLEVAAGWPGVVLAQPAAAHDAVASATTSQIAWGRENIDMTCSFRADPVAGRRMGVP
jgi:hypothetical protein